MLLRSLCQSCRASLILDRMHLLILQQQRLPCLKDHLLRSRTSIDWHMSLDFLQ